MAAVYIMILTSSVVLLKSEIDQIFKKPLALMDDCMIVQSSAREMPVLTLNIWTVITVFTSLLYLTGAMVAGALPVKLLYVAAICHLLTIFFDYSFMAGFRDCCEFDFLRWRVDAWLRSGLYIWTAGYVMRNFCGIIGP